MRVLFIGTMVLVVALGGATTGYYLDLLPPGAAPPWAALALGFVVTAALTLMNLGLRWMRWHFLTRRFALFFRTRESLKLYFATLPMLAVPLFLGELARPLTIAASDPRGRRVVLQVWFLERLMDVGALSVWWLVGLRYWLWVSAGLALNWAFAWGVIAFFEKRRANPRPKRDAFVFGAAVVMTSAVAWLLPSFALYAILQLLSAADSGWAVLEAFSSGTLLGGLSGLPLGVGVTGSHAVSRLVAAGSSLESATWAVLALRLGTAWFAIAFGGLLLYAWRNQLPRLSTQASALHFDELAPEYAQEIPEHIRQRLLLRKTHVMLEGLRRRRQIPGALRGLDLGCGQGWYAIEMAKAGFAMAGTDASSGQLARARSNARYHQVELELRQNEAGALPFEAESFDFVYTINVIHHVLVEEDRRALFADVMRVLRPGGIVFLHEMNTLNPLFRFYMSYVFPLLRRIDEGTERWVNPKALPVVAGGSWVSTQYFTFLPDFLPRPLLRLLKPLEDLLENSPLRHHSAHYVAMLVKEGGAGNAESLRPSSAGAGQRTQVVGL